MAGLGFDIWAQGWRKTCFDAPHSKNKLTLRRNSSKFLKVWHKNRNISATEAKASNQGLTFITWENDIGFGKAGEGHWQNAGLEWQIRNTNAYLATRLMQSSIWGVMLQFKHRCRCIIWHDNKENNSVFLNHWPPTDQRPSDIAGHRSNFLCCYKEAKAVSDPVRVSQQKPHRGGIRHSSLLPG